jgi:hypothetical protein
MRDFIMCLEPWTDVAPLGCLVVFTYFTDLLISVNIFLNSVDRNILLTLIKSQLQKYVLLIPYVSYY